MFRTCLPAGRYKKNKKIMPARHLPARALQWQAGRSRSGPARRTAGGEAGGLILFTRHTSGGLILSKKFRRRRLSSAKDVAWQPLREKQLIGSATVLAPWLAGKGASCYVTKSREKSRNRRGYPGTD